MTLRLHAVLWPIHDWSEARDQWQAAEQMGFTGGWVYDHLAWRGHTPWDDAYVTLAAAAAVTETIRLGTLVTSPNFRTPIPTASTVRTIDRISGGRIDLGIGAGGANHTSDGDVLDRDFTPKERADRFAEWVDQLDTLLTTSPASATGSHWSAREVTIAEGLVQQRPPFWIAANGPRGLRLAARQGQGWISNPGQDDPVDDVRRTTQALESACEAEGRDPATIRRLLLTGHNDEPWLESVSAFGDLAGEYADLGITDIAVHWPRPGTDWDADLGVLEAVAHLLAP